MTGLDGRDASSSTQDTFVLDERSSTKITLIRQYIG